MWTKRPDWLLVPEDAVEDKYYEKPDAAFIPYPALLARTIQRRQEGRCEIPWTNQDEFKSEDQSSVVHLAGFLITHCTAHPVRRMTCPSRKDQYFEGWDERLEPPVGRPIANWDDIESRVGRPTPEESLATSEASTCVSVWDAGSSVGSSIRTGSKPPTKETIQGCTLQDEELGSLKKLPNEP